MTDDAAIHGGDEDTARDTEQALRAHLASLTAENERYRKALKQARHALDAEAEPNIEIGWEKANAILNAVLAPTPEQPPEERN